MSIRSAYSERTTIVVRFLPKLGREMSHGLFFAIRPAISLADQAFGQGCKEDDSGALPGCGCVLAFLAKALQQGVASLSSRLQRIS